MDVKTLLNQTGDFKPFVVEKTTLEGREVWPTLVVEVRERAKRKARCSECEKACPCYDRVGKRYWEHVPLWGMMVLVGYARRRVKCPEHGVVVEWVPWAVGKHRLTMTYMWFLARWAKRLSIEEVGEVFPASWNKVFQSVEWAVKWGLEHRDVKGVKAIGVDELQLGWGQDYVTLVYQIEEACRRLLWVGKERTKDCLRGFFKEFGEEWTAGLEFICSDMWKNYLDVIKEKARRALNVLDRYHLMANMNKAIDEVRAKEAKELKAEGNEILKHKRWVVLKQPENLTEKQEVKLRELLRHNLKTVRSYLLKADFEQFWTYVSPYWAGKFLDKWCTRVMRSRIEPMKKIAQSMREHRPLILNWFKARQAAVSLGAVEGFNNKAGVIKRRAYGFRTYRVFEVMLYHNLGELPEPEVKHHFSC